MEDVGEGQLTKIVAFLPPQGVVCGGWSLREPVFLLRN